MENTTKSPRMLSIIVLYDMHTQYFINVLDGISDTDALKRLDTKANHVAWLAGSLVQERFELAGLMGIKDQQKAVDLFKNHQGIKDGIDYPSLLDFKADWERISPILRDKLLVITDEELDAILEFPEMDMRFPMYEMVTFNTYREANCIGQIVLWRRLLGYEPMQYM